MPDLKTKNVHVPLPVALKSKWALRHAPEEVRAFRGSAIITDMDAFKHAVYEYVSQHGWAPVQGAAPSGKAELVGRQAKRAAEAGQGRVKHSRLLPKQPQVASTPTSTPTHAPAALGSPVAAFIATQAWAPSEVSIEAGRKAQQSIFMQPEQRTVSEFAALVGKTPQAVRNDIKERRLLSLKLDVRKQRVPSWQANFKVKQFVSEVLAQAPTLDAWTTYQALTAPVGVLGGKTLVQACQQGLAPTERLLEVFQAELGLMPSTATLVAASSGV
jgi:hypothetical protein